MKKKLFIIALAAISLNVFGYTTEIRNRTDGQIVVKISYAGRGFCSPDEILIRRKTRRKIKTGGCCTISPIIITSKSGEAKGHRIKYRPPRTGAGASCKSFIFRVRNTAGGGLVAETVTE